MFLKKFETMERNPQKKTTHVSGFSLFNNYFLLQLSIINKLTQFSCDISNYKAIYIQSK